VNTPDDLLKSGEYARKQIYCRSGLVRWSHGSRFELARALVAPRAGGRLLDYGCGDGTFVAMVHGDFAETVGLDVDPKHVDEAAARLGVLPGVRFGMTSAPCPAPFDVVTCMEVLEHCLEDERRRVRGGAVHVPREARARRRVERGGRRRGGEQRRDRFVDRGVDGGGGQLDVGAGDRRRDLRYVGVQTNHAWLLRNGPSGRIGENSRRAIVKCAASSRPTSR